MSDLAPYFVLCENYQKILAEFGPLVLTLRRTSPDKRILGTIGYFVRLIALHKAIESKINYVVDADKKSELQFMANDLNEMITAIPELFQFNQSEFNARVNTFFQSQPLPSSPSRSGITPSSFTSARTQSPRSADEAPSTFSMRYQPRSADEAPSTFSMRYQPRSAEAPSTFSMRY